MIASTIIPERNGFLWLSYWVFFIPDKIPFPHLSLRDISSKVQIKPHLLSCRQLCGYYRQNIKEARILSSIASHLWNLSHILVHTEISWELINDIRRLNYYQLLRSYRGRMCFEAFINVCSKHFHVCSWHWCLFLATINLLVISIDIYF